MKKLLYILLLVVAYAMFNPSESANVREGEKLCVDGEYVSGTIDDNFRVEQLCCKEYNSDMLRSPNTTMSFGQSNNNSISNIVRSRVESHSKTISQAVPERHAGHVTQIFEFNHFRSSLRVVYYLYVLCRLRI